MMSPDDLQKIRALAMCKRVEDVRLFAIARTAIPALLDEVDLLRLALTEALDLFDATWCPEHGHAPRPKQLARAEALRKLVSQP